MLKHLALVLSVLTIWSSSVMADPVRFNFRVAEAKTPAPVVHGGVELAPVAFYANLTAPAHASARAARPTEPSPAAAEPPAEASRPAGLNMGFRPKLGRVRLDLGYSRATGTCCGVWSARMNRPLGRATIEAGVAFDAGAGVSLASTEAKIPLTRSLTMRGRLDGRVAREGGERKLRAEIGLARSLSSASHLDVRLQGASDASGRAELVLRRTF